MVKTQQIFNLDYEETEQFKKNCKALDKKYSDVISDLMIDFNKQFKEARGYKIVL